MKNFNRAVLVTLIASALTGCFGEDKIKEVKGLTYDNIDPTNTLGNALDTRKMCKETKWEAGKDERKREVVTYTCELTGYEVYFSQWNDNYVGQLAAINLPKLEQAKRDYDRVKEDKKNDLHYFAFVEKMGKQNVIPALALVKKKTPSIVSIANFAMDQTAERAKEIGVPEENIPAFVTASKLYTSALESKEYGDDFIPIFVNRGYRSSFEAIIDAVNEGKTAGDVIEIQKKELYNSDKNIADAKEALDKIESVASVAGLEKIRQSWEANQPVKIVQRIVYATSSVNPQLLTCEFEFYTPNSKSAIAYKKKVESNTTCLQISYQSGYSKFYTDMLGKVFVDQKDRK